MKRKKKEKRIKWRDKKEKKYKRKIETGGNKKKSVMSD